MTLYDQNANLTRKNKNHCLKSMTLETKKIRNGLNLIYGMLKDLT